MSYEGLNLKTVGCVPTAAIAENVAVMLDAAHTAQGIGVKTATAGAEIYGINGEAITADDVTNGITADIVTDGEMKLVELGATPGTIAAGDKLKADASGKAVKTTTALDSIIGIALAPGNTEGDLIPVSLRPGASVKAAS